jgi:hypothetical protein
MTFKFIRPNGSVTSSFSPTPRWQQAAWPGDVRATSRSISEEFDCGLQGLTSRNPNEPDEFENPGQIVTTLCLGIVV